MGRDISHPETVYYDLNWKKINSIRAEIAEETKPYLKRIINVAKGKA